MVISDRSLWNRRVERPSPFKRRGDVNAKTSNMGDSDLAGDLWAGCMGNGNHCDRSKPDYLG